MTADLSRVFFCKPIINHCFFACTDDGSGSVQDNQAMAPEKALAMARRCHCPPERSTPFFPEQILMFQPLFLFSSLSTTFLQKCKLYCRPPGFTVVPPGKYLAGGQQSDCTANLTGVQYILYQSSFPHVMLMKTDNHSSFSQLTVFLHDIFYTIFLYAVFSEIPVSLCRKALTLLL